MKLNTLIGLAGVEGGLGGSGSRNLTSASQETGAAARAEKTFGRNTQARLRQTSARQARCPRHYPGDRRSDGVERRFVVNPYILEIFTSKNIAGRGDFGAIVVNH
jgi:hypothetical protein